MRSVSQKAKLQNALLSNTEMYDVTLSDITLFDTTLCDTTLFMTFRRDKILSDLITSYIQSSDPILFDKTLSDIFLTKYSLPLCKSRSLLVAQQLSSFHPRHCDNTKGALPNGGLSTMPVFVHVFIVSSLGNKVQQALFGFICWLFLVS